MGRSMDQLPPPSSRHRRLAVAWLAVAITATIVRATADADGLLGSERLGHLLEIWVIGGIAAIAVAPVPVRHITRAATAPAVVTTVLLGSLAVEQLVGVRRIVQGVLLRTWRPAVSFRGQLSER